MTSMNAKHSMWSVDGILLSENEVISRIGGMYKGLVVLDGPSGCGKNSLVRKLDVHDTTVISSEKMVNEIISLVREDIHDVEDAVKTQFQKKIVCLEDVDYELKGKPETTALVRRVIGKVLEEHVVILTGIGIKERIPDLLGGMETVYLKGVLYG